jgi:hypothetical protein
LGFQIAQMLVGPFVQQLAETLTFTQTFATFGHVRRKFLQRSRTNPQLFNALALKVLTGCLTVAISF